MNTTKTKKRCKWVPEGNLEYTAYHDQEWGRVVHDDRLLFEMLNLEGAQAGLSWLTILRKRAGYRRAFANFDAHQLARYTAAKQAKLMQDEGIVRNRLKIRAVVENAKAFLAVQKEFGSFDTYVWQFTDRKTSRPAGQARHRRKRRDEQGSQEARLPLCGPDHSLCFYAGRGTSKRPPEALLSRGG